MENQLQKVNQSINLTDKQLSIALLVVEVNMLIPYALTDTQIENWSRTIDRLMPDIDLKLFGDVLDEYKLDIREWDKTKGIQNILGALRPQGYSPEETN